MRILRLRFKNLNSLAGEWTIDFTHPDYVTAGIFAITGPTGSGKTTILDAISLGLYGKTPRLEKITKSTNEIMTRNTGECFAEVVFESQKGKFVSHWSQRRAHNRPDGDLQPPKHEISDLITHEVVESKLSKIQDKIIETIGLDYNQFTRSILLAQGDFATFLNAEAGERSPILEKITGTEIYSEISQKVQQRNAIESARRDEIKEKIGNIEILTDEEAAALKIECREKKEEVRKFSDRREAIGKSVSWLENISRLEHEITDLEARKVRLEEKKSRASEDLSRLNSAKKAATLEELFGKLVAGREVANNLEKNLMEIEKKIGASSLALEKSFADWMSKRENLEKIKETRTRENGLITTVRALDTRISGFTLEINEKTRELKEFQDKIREYGVRCAQNENDLEAQRALLDDATAYLKENDSDAWLSEELSGFEERLRHYARVHEAVESDRLREETQRALLPRLNMTLANQERLLKEKQYEYEENEKSALQLQGILDQTLDNRDITFWYDLELLLNKRKTTLESLVSVYDSVAVIDRKIRNLERPHAHHIADLKQKEELLSSLNREKTAGQELLKLAETNFELLDRVESLEEERALLEDGKPCPLCGALNHPYARGNVPSSDTARNELTKIRRDLEELNAKISSQENIVLKAKEDLSFIEAQCRNQKDQIQTLLLGSDMGFDDPLYIARACNLKRVLRSALRRCEEHLSWCSDIWKSAEKMKRELEEANKRAITAKQQLIDLNTAYQATGLEYRTCVKLIGEMEERIRSAGAEVKASSGTILVDLRKLGYDSIPLENIEELIEALRSRKRKFETMKKSELDIREKITGLSNELQNIHGFMAKDSQSVNAALNWIQEKENTVKTLSEERKSLYSDKNPSDEEKKMAVLAESAQKSFESSSGICEGLKSRLSALNEQKAQDSQKSEEHRSSFQEIERVFIETVQRAGFSDEAEFAAARIPRDLFLRLEKMEQELIQEERDIASGLEKNTRLLELEQERALTDKTVEVMKEEIAACDEHINEINQRLGAISQRLATHHEMMAKKSDLITALEKQDLECIRWERLHALIGSADGKKFRNFAQGLTFDRLVSHANEHLRKMSDRYLLIRREGSLDLDIMDDYQAGETRSTKNLSGGESFIVSLALALGLSGMASKNVRIDSLFLDEGFGSLDNDTLDTALETLSGLQQEGKIIGIISHVPALKERITTRIRVIPLQGGRSRLEAPGCSSRGNALPS